MRTVLKAIAACLLLFAALGVFVAIRADKAGNSGNSATNSSRVSEEQAQKVSALKLFIDYQRNEVAADNIYKGRLLAVTGIVTSINKDMFDKVYVSLATPNQFMNVQAHLDGESESQAAALERGHGVTVICTGGGMILGSPMLQRCSFAKLHDEAAIPSPMEPQPAVHQNEPLTSNSEQATIEPTNTGNDELKPVGGAASVPVVISSVAPEIPAAAIEAKMGANVLVHLVVDRNGLPTDVQAVRTVYIDRDGHASGGPNSAGDNLGFSENAVESVRRYRFRPAMENGVPVPAELNVNVSYPAP